MLKYVSDIYIACVSSAHNVCPKGYWIAIVSTIAESSANHHLELQPGIDRLGKIEEQFMVCSREAASLKNVTGLKRGFFSRVPLSPSTSPPTVAAPTTSSSQRATMRPAISRPPQTTSRTSTAAAPVKNSRWRVFVRASRFRTSNKYVLCGYAIVIKSIFGGLDSWKKQPLLQIQSKCTLSTFG